MSSLHKTLSRSLSALAFIGASMTAVTASADTNVFVTNNTAKPIEIQLSSTLPKAHWRKGNTVIPPFSRKKIFRTSRHKGVKNGKTYTFTGRLIARDSKKPRKVHAQGPNNFEIKLKLRGTPTHSHMWQSHRTQAGSQGSWEDDRKKYGAKLHVGKRQWAATYWAYATEGDDDVEYVFREDYPKPTGRGKKVTADWRSRHLNVLAYNTFLRPAGVPLPPKPVAGLPIGADELFPDGQETRVPLIPAQLKGYDVVVLQEVFDDNLRPKLLAGMAKQGYKYASEPLGAEGTVEDGGVVIVSRYPIVNQKPMYYSRCAGSDCLGSKGAVWVRINKRAGGKDHFFNVFGTHLQAGAEWGVRKSQLRELKKFIDRRKAIRNGEAVIIAGDLNVNLWKTSDPNEFSESDDFRDMLRILDAEYFKGAQIRGHLRKDLTHDGPVNDLGEGSKSYLDYVLVSKADKHRKIMKSSFAEVRVPRSYGEWKHLATDKARWDLSDHYAIYGSLHFESDGLGFDPGYGQGPDAPIYLCNTDDQCPSALTCQKFPPGQGIPPNAVPPPSKGKPKAAKTSASRGMAKRGGTSKAAASRGATSRSPIKRRGTAQTGKPKAGKAGSRAMWSGTCRVPPPK